MTTIERRRLVVSLYQGHYEQQIADLGERAVREAESQLRRGPRRSGEGAPGLDHAAKHDALVAEAEETAVKVTVWALRWDEWDDLVDLHPPREGEKRDEVNDVNMKSFPRALLCASLVEPDEYKSVARMVEAGERILHDLAPSRVHYAKLERAAWNVNAGEEELPKVSLVSLLTAASDSESGEPSEQE